MIGRYLGWRFDYGKTIFKIFCGGFFDLRSKNRSLLVTEWKLHITID